MLLRLPILQYARVNTLLLPCNNQALFVPLSVYKITGAVKLFSQSIFNSFLVVTGFGSQSLSSSKVWQSTHFKNAPAGPAVYSNYRLISIALQRSRLLNLFTSPVLIFRRLLWSAENLSVRFATNSRPLRGESKKACSSLSLGILFSQSFHYRKDGIETNAFMRKCLSALVSPPRRNGRGRLLNCRNHATL